MKKFFSTRRLLAVSGVAALLLIFASCKKSDNNNPDVPVAGLMAFNLASDKPAIGFALSGNSLTNSPLTYPNYTGGYLGIYTGNRTVAAFDASSGSTITSLDYAFDKDKYYSLFFVGNGSAYKNVVVSDNIDSLSGSSGKAYIRYVNAIADSVSQPMVTIADNAGNIIEEAAGFSKVSHFAAATPGTVTINVNDNNAIQTNRTITLENKKVYTALLIGVPGSTDTAKSVQIRYIENGTLSEDTASQEGFSHIQPRAISVQ
ncbi:MAG: DUF4397 domain-containing protein [Agriterribacter sp.]